MRNKGNIVAIVVILVALFLGGGLIFINKQSNKTIKSEPDKIIRNEVPDRVKLDVVQTVSQSRYVSYSKSSFDGAVDKRRVLYFHADW